MLDSIIHVRNTRARARYALICGWILLFSCGAPSPSTNSVDTDADTDTEPICTARESESCTCDDGREGTAECASGVLGECDCGEPRSEGCHLLDEWVSHGLEWDCVYHRRQVVVTPFTLDAELLVPNCVVHVAELETYIRAEDIIEVRPGPEALVEPFGSYRYACYLPGQTDSRGLDVPCDDDAVCQDELVCRTSVCLPVGQLGEPCSGHDQCEDGLYCFDGCQECSTPECPERLPGCVDEFDQRRECLSCIDSQIRNDICLDSLSQLDQCRQGCSGHPDYLECIQSNCGSLSHNYNVCELHAQETARQRCLQE